MKSYKKIYLEITNVCNLSCCFCHKTKREKRFMTAEEFALLAAKIRPYTEYLCLHLMGEPLLHPALGELLSICSSLGFRVTLSTNGTLIRGRGPELLNAPALYKTTFSLHSFEANKGSADLGSYMDDIILFCLKAAERGVICVLRLWNDGGKNSLNGAITGKLRDAFPRFSENMRGFSLGENIYLEFDRGFVWPDLGEKKREVRFCRGLRDHLGVLCDGTVVPCCLDADGEIALGNLFETELADIISSPRARALYTGFSEGKCAEELCSRCEYAQRFNK